MWDWLAEHREALAAIQSGLTSAAIVAGGVWAWREYRRRRDPNPKVRLRHAVTHRRLPGQRIWLRVELHVENCGTTLLKLTAGLTRISQVLPLEDQVPNRMPSPFSRERAWPSLLNDEKEWNEVAIEPGEPDMVVYDFIFPDGPATVVVYSHVENTNRKGTPFGWQASTVYEIESDGTTKEHSITSPRAADSEADSPNVRQLAGPNTPAGREAANAASKEEVAPAVPAKLLNPEPIAPQEQSSH